MKSIYFMEVLCGVIQPYRLEAEVPGDCHCLKY